MPQPSDSLLFRPVSVNMEFAVLTLLPEMLMIDIMDIQSLTDFQRNTREHIRHLEKTGRPEALTINGRAKLIVQEARHYRAKLGAYEDWLAVKRGIEDFKAGRVRPIEDVFDELDTKYFGKPLRRRKK